MQCIRFKHSKTDYNSDTSPWAETLLLLFLAIGWKTKGLAWHLKKTFQRRHVYCTIKAVQGVQLVAIEICRRWGCQKPLMTGRGRRWWQKNRCRGYRAPYKARTFISMNSGHQIRPVKLTSIDSIFVISSLNPMFDHLLESSRWDDSNKWSKHRIWWTNKHYRNKYTHFIWSPD